MPSKTKVSIILTSYDHAKYLRESIESALAQSFTDFELIIWDDHSEDNSWEIIRSYQDPRIKAICNEKRERGAWGLNRAIQEIARGEFIAVHHSDDAWEPQKLASQVSLLDSNPSLGAAFTWATIIGEEGELLQNEAHPYAKVFDQPNRSRHEWLRYFFYHGNALCHPSALVRRKCYADIGVYRYGLAQWADLDLWVRLCMKHEIFVLPERLVRFRVRNAEGNASGDRADARVRSRLEFLKILELYRGIRSPEELLQIFPEAEGHKRDGKIDVDFALAMLALEAQTSYPPNGLRLFGWNILFDLLNKHQKEGSAASAGGFGVNEFVELGGHQDVFQVETVYQLSVQLAKAIQHGQELAEAHLQVQALAEARQQQIWEITHTRAWRVVVWLQRLRARALPRNSWGSRTLKRVWSIILYPFAGRGRPEKARNKKIGT